MLENHHQSGAMDRAARLAKVQQDLLEEINKYPSEKIALKTISNKAGVHERTLKRIIKGSHSPTYQTILKIYRYLKGTFNDRETVLAMPEILGTYVEDEHDNFSLTNSKTVFSNEIDTYLKSDSVFRAIYVESATGEIHKDAVAFQHGQHGVNVLFKMNELNIVKEVKPDVFTSSVNRASLDAVTLHEISKYLIEYKFSPEKANLSGENFYECFFEGVDQESYNELLKIDWDCYQKKKKFLKEMCKKGEVKYWSISFTDTLTKSLIYDDHPNKEVIQ